MKKILLSVALLCAAMCMNAEKLQVVERDTVAWDKGVRVEATQKVTALGETRVSRKAILYVLDGEKKVEKKVAISRDTYDALQAGAQAWVVLTVYEDGSEKITKVLAK
jgi:hypothetical protein